MSSITSLFSSGGGGGGTPVNGIAKLDVGGEILHTDADGQVWLKTGYVIVGEESTYPDAKIGDIPFFSTATYNSQHLAGTSYGIAANLDGSKIYISTGSSIDQYSATDGNLSTAVSDGVSIPVGGNRGLRISRDGLRLYCGTYYSGITQCNLSTPWDLSSYTGNIFKSIDIRYGWHITEDSETLYTIPSATPRTLYRYALINKTDITNIKSIGAAATNLGYDDSSRNFWINGSGSYFLTQNNSANAIYGYCVNTPFDFANYSSNGFGSGGYGTAGISYPYYGLNVSFDRSKIYVCDYTGGTYQLDLQKYIGHTASSVSNEYLRIK